MTKRAVLYARKSTIDKAAWAGLESQLELGREYAAVVAWLKGWLGTLAAEGEQDAGGDPVGEG